MQEIYLLLANINRYVNLNSQDEVLLSNACALEEVKKRKHLVIPGTIFPYQVFVISGALRSYTVDNKGQEHTLQFAVEDWFISDFNSYVNSEPTSIFIETLENSKILKLSHHLIEEACDKSPRIDRYFRLVAQKAFAYSQKRVLANISNTAEERFLNFYNLYPDISERVPQYALASYLGMTPEFLSKVKKKISSS